MTTLDIRNPLTFTMRELAQKTGQVIERINKENRPALITRHGSFVAMITPLGDRKVETLALREIAQDMADRSSEEGSELSSDQLLKEYPDEKR